MQKIIRSIFTETAKSSWYMAAWICTYVDKTSVVSEYYNPPYYRLAANVLTYNIDKGTLYKTKTVHYSYDTSTGAISSGGGAPLYDRPNSNIAANQRPVEVAK